MLKTMLDYEEEPYPSTRDGPTARDGPYGEGGQQQRPQPYDEPPFGQQLYDRPPFGQPLYGLPLEAYAQPQPPFNDYPDAYPSASTRFADDYFDYDEPFPSRGDEFLDYEDPGYYEERYPPQVSYYAPRARGRDPRLYQNSAYPF